MYVNLSEFLSIFTCVIFLQYTIDNIDGKEFFPLYDNIYFYLISLTIFEQQEEMYGRLKKFPLLEISTQYLSYFSCFRATLTIAY